MNPLKISLTISLLGIIILLILANTLEQKLTNIKELTINDLNKKIKIQGKIMNIKNYENSKTNELFYVLTISDGAGQIDVVLNIKKTLNLKINQNVTIMGRVNTYKNQLQIQAEKIVV
ncbi:MAG: OB-fold nucleic acid binding domain-containing protein [Nanoarchaeota archaeon]